jgi:hypothetical protein
VEKVKYDEISAKKGVKIKKTYEKAYGPIKKQKKIFEKNLKKK